MLVDGAPDGGGDGRPNKVAILDCGAQYAKVIDRRVRELFVESDLLPVDTSFEFLSKNYRAVILSGGPQSVNDANAVQCDARLFGGQMPVLGICYGLQLINRHFGGTVEKKSVREDGQHLIAISPECPIFHGLAPRQLVLLTHGDSIDRVADNFREVGHSDNIIVAIAAASVDNNSNVAPPIFGVQFHPEVDLTPNGAKMLHNFLFGVAKCQPTFTMRCREQMCLDELAQVMQQQKPQRKIFALCSGGVDSTVLAALLRKCVKPENLFAVHIDNGFMRKDESAHVEQSLKAVGVDLRVYKRDYLFYNATTDILDRKTGQTAKSLPLCHVCDPEVKRKIIGDTFMRLTKSIMINDLKLNPDDVFIAQGTLRPDLIESASSIVSGKADAIKTHHNDTPLVRELRKRGLVIEPLKDFHKDEVRDLGRDLGLPDSIVSRHPFPGPGLAIRILCRTEPYTCAQFKETQLLLQAIVTFSSSADSAHVNKLKCCFSTTEQQKLSEISGSHRLRATLLPIQAVGVQGDARTYSYVAALSLDTAQSNPESPAIDRQTSKSMEVDEDEGTPVRPPSYPVPLSERKVPWPDLFELARMIPKAAHNINRVAFVFGEAVRYAVNDVTPIHLNSHTVALLQEVDHLVTESLRDRKLTDRISQMPVVLLPVHFDRPVSAAAVADEPSTRYSVCLRPFLTRDFMTGTAVMPSDDDASPMPSQTLNEIVAKILDVAPYVSRVLYDMTAKPPATTEWE